MDLNVQMKKLAEGDVSAFDFVYERTSKAVYYVALSVLRDRALAEDAMQATYATVLQKAALFSRGEHAAAWIAKIAKNTALNLLKKRSREVAVDVREEERLFGTTTEDARYGLTELAGRVLDEEDFRILMLIAVQGYKRREVSEFTGMPIGTVTWRYEKALKTLRKNLEQGAER